MRLRVLSATSHYIMLALVTSEIHDCYLSHKLKASNSLIVSGSGSIGSLHSASRRNVGNFNVSNSLSLPQPNFREIRIDISTASVNGSNIGAQASQGQPVNPLTRTRVSKLQSVSRSHY